mmetsp:Transcript_1070/g.2952  ORF Transcript_1070/g.2952 Transcript_1070/m.2952 type:complete len:99 (+) Transcript_1070:458-754(+)
MILVSSSFKDPSSVDVTEAVSSVKLPSSASGIRRGRNRVFEEIPQHEFHHYLLQPYQGLIVEIDIISRGDETLTERVDTDLKGFITNPLTENIRHNSH